MRSTLKTFRFKTEYLLIVDFLFNPKVIRGFIQKEMNFIFQNSGKEKYFSIILRNDNTYEKYSNKFNLKFIDKQKHINHSGLYLIFSENQTSGNNYNEILDKNSSFFNVKIDLYKDITDNSAFLINELSANLGDDIFEKINDLIKFFYKKLYDFIREKMTKYFCHQSVSIDKNIKSIYDFIFSCKVVENKNFKIQNSKSIKNGIEIEWKIDSIFPVDNCEARLIIIKLEHNLCLVEVLIYMNIGDYNIQEKLLDIEPKIQLFLKILKDRMSNKNAFLTSVNM